MNQKIGEIVELFDSKPYLLEMGANTIANRYKLNVLDVKDARVYIRQNRRQFGANQFPEPTQNKTKVVINNNENVLVIGDLHAPFIKKGYLEHCLHIYNKYNCNQVVFLGDILDNHALSTHETSIKAASVEEELDQAIYQLRRWYKAFPNAFVCYGNHDLRSAKRMQSSGIPRKWMQNLKEVLQTPNWTYAEAFVINDVLYVHGEGRKAKNRMDDELISVVQGHWHSESSIIFTKGMNRKLFSMQIGCGIDRSYYAFDYGKHFKEPHLNCGVVLNNGTLPIIEWME